MIRLPDVNVLVAAMWPEHLFHAAAQHWFDGHVDAGWATCSTTELGFIRVSSNASAVGDPVRPAEAATLLAELRQVGAHEFWADDIAPAVDLAAGTTLGARLVGHRQVTEAHLLRLATRHGGRLVTFDRGIVDGGLAERGTAEVIG